MMERLHAEVVAIGDEITSGQTLDTNSQWLSRRLEELGVRVLYHTTVGDELQPNVEVFQQAVERADVVVATGGLGPTADDLTREALAAAIGQPLLLDPEALAQIRALFARRKRPMPPQNEVQALLPQGSHRIDNPHGTAPGIAVEIARPGRRACWFFALPGVPAEMKEMWQASVAGRLRQAAPGRRVVLRKNIKCFGAGESQIEAMLPDMIRRGRVPTVGITASQATIMLRIAAEGQSEEECEALIAPTAATIHECLGALVFGQGEDELQDVVLRQLAARKATLALAEYGTAGLVADWLGASAESQGQYLGGVVAAGTAALERLLEIPADWIDRHTAVSAPVAERMADACRRRFGADYALAIGGFPPADPAAAEASSVHFAIASAAGVQTKAVPYAAHPALLRVLCGKHALNMLRLALLDGPPNVKVFVGST
jgi:nicotinamide-nucleotide amidase